MLDHEPRISTRRELFNRFLPDRKAFVVDGNIAISEVPPVPTHAPQPFKIDYLAILAAAGMLIASNSKLIRRDALKIPALFVALPNMSASEKQDRQVVSAGYELSRGLHRSYPWLPADGTVEGEAATGLNAGGPWDKYDALDRIINGDNARSAWWRPTRDWLIEAAFKALKKSNWADKGWTGYCMDAGAAAFFAPRIEGPIDIAGIHFTLRDRLVIATMRWSGLARDPIDPNNAADITNRVNSGQCVVVNNSIVSGQEWWGVVREGVHSDGTVVSTRYLRWGEEDGLKTESRQISELRGAKVLHEDRPEPGDFEGNFAVVDRPLGNLILAIKPAV